MNRFKYLIFVILYCFLLKQGCNDFYIFVCLVLITVYFFIKHINLIKRLNVFGKNHQNSMNEQRENFINSLSHDLRIPVIAQLRALELLRTEQLGNLLPAQKDILEQIVQSSKCILNLISLLINIYSIENNTPNLSYQRFNLHELVVSCFNELKIEAADKNLTYEYECDRRNLYINANKEEIRKVLINLILSEIMYSNYGGKILIKVINKDNKLRLSFSCDGKNSCTVNMDLNSKYTAIGESIRLHFCRKIIEIHKGHFLNQKNSKGSIVFELPTA